ncbi:hypothetical protein [Fusibacter sp. 3D3]|uniref:hypothetical protein n=1 Tax=Fusibacter sp. 3D3 TaxID=1048380 RepID=UPI000855EEF6|nr:hypothetical protein [Fusibacter sp. 3D3]GAU78030.1 hypothetical protein F3D3_2659 [Fusibacter sp. 3D3]
MNFRKLGIKILWISILGAVLLGQLQIKGGLVMALTVFGIGSGLILIFLGDLSKFEK